MQDGHQASPLPSEGENPPNRGSSVQIKCRESQIPNFDNSPAVAPGVADPTPAMEEALLGPAKDLWYLLTYRSLVPDWFERKCTAISRLTLAIERAEKSLQKSPAQKRDTHGFKSEN